MKNIDKKILIAEEIKQLQNKKKTHQSAETGITKEKI